MRNSFGPRQAMARARGVAIGAVGAVVASARVLGLSSASFAAAPKHDRAATFSVTGAKLPSTTLFNLTLPAGAKCRTGGGNGTQFVSFLVPAKTNLATLSDTDNPEADSAGVVDQGVALANAEGFVPFEFADATPPGQIDTGDYFAALDMAGVLRAGVTVTGPQLPLPNTALIPKGSTSAKYEAGVVCFSPANAETDYWSAALTFTSVPKGKGTGKDPNGFVWSITKPAAVEA